MLVSLDTISPDASTQARHGTDKAVIADYAEAMREGATFPPVVLFRDADGTIRVGDGFHRIAAARLAGMTGIEAETRDGGAREALGHSILSNARHGLRFNNRDKRRVVGIMIGDPEWSKLSDREIARRCGVSQPFVGKLRPDRGDNRYQPPDPLSPEEQADLDALEAIIGGAVAKARAALESVAAVKKMLPRKQYEPWLNRMFKDDWPGYFSELELMLGSSDDWDKIRAVYPFPMIGDLPVGHLDPGCEYLSGEGKRGTIAKVSPSTTPGYWFVTAFGLAAKIVESMKRPIREDALPTAIHACGFVCDDDPKWMASPCFPVAGNDDPAGG